MKKIQKNLLALAAIAVILSAGIIPNPNTNPNPKDFPTTGNSATTGEQAPGENKDDNDGGKNENKPNCDDDPKPFLG